VETKWRTPKLIRLSRGQPEEAVLMLCKGAFTAPGELNMGSAFQGCYHQDGFCNCCLLQAES